MPTTCYLRLAIELGLQGFLFLLVFSKLVLIFPLFLVTGVRYPLPTFCPFFFSISSGVYLASLGDRRVTPSLRFLRSSAPPFSVTARRFVRGDSFISFLAWISSWGFCVGTVSHSNWMFIPLSEFGGIFLFPRFLQAVHLPSHAPVPTFCGLTLVL